MDSRSCGTEYLGAPGIRDQAESHSKGRREYDDHAQLGRRVLHKVQAQNRSEQQRDPANDRQDVDDRRDSGFFEATKVVGSVATKLFLKTASQ